MYQGDETYTFRSEKPGRGRNRQAGRLKYDPPASTPLGPGGEGGAAPAGRSTAEERVARLEAAVNRLEELVGQVAEALTAVEQTRPAPRPLGQSHGEEQAVQMLEAFRDDDVPTAGVSGENLRVSLFTDGGASAVLGQVRILD